MVQTVRRCELLQVGHPLRQRFQRTKKLSTTTTTTTTIPTQLVFTRQKKARVEAAGLERSAAAAVKVDSCCFGGTSFLCVCLCV